jgi:hypothetical protein
MYESAGIIGDVWAFATKCYMGWNPKFQVIYQVVFLFLQFPLDFKITSLQDTSVIYLILKRKLWPP